MNKYESVVIINPNVDEAGLKALEDKFTGLINANGKVAEVENMGKKNMVFKFEANPTLIAELERVYRITDEVLKFITTRNID